MVVINFSIVLNKIETIIEFLLQDVKKHEEDMASSRY